MEPPTMTAFFIARLSRGADDAIRIRRDYDACRA